MLFWIIATALALVVAAMVLRPLFRGVQAGADRSDVALYHAQLEEIERDLAREVMDAEEAERARVEVARRLLSAQGRAAQATVSASSPGVAMGLAALLVAGAAGLYLIVGTPGEPDRPLAQRLATSEAMRAARPGQAALEAAATPLPAVEAPQDYLDSIAQLRAIVPTRPDDLQGWELLAFHEAELRNFAAAAVAQARVVTLKGDAATVIDLQRQMDLMVLAADSIVSPEAESLARQILERDPQNIAARYQIGALYAQTDRADLAFRLWRPLVELGGDSYHVSLARLQIEDAAVAAGLEYTLPEQRGPSLAEMNAAQDMAPEDRAAMIGNMVAGLADRLATEGGTAGEWARLITAYGVLGETDAARAVWNEARTVFANDTDAMTLLAGAAQGAGVSE